MCRGIKDTGFLVIFIVSNSTPLPQSRRSYPASRYHDSQRLSLPRCHWGRSASTLTSRGAGKLNVSPYLRLVLRLMTFWLIAIPFHQFRPREDLSSWIPKKGSIPQFVFRSCIYSDEILIPVFLLVASLEALEGRPGRLNLDPSVSLSVRLLGSTSESFTTDRVKCGSIVNWNSNTPVWVQVAPLRVCVSLPQPDASFLVFSCMNPHKSASSWTTTRLWGRNQDLWDLLPSASLICCSEHQRVQIESRVSQGTPFCHMNAHFFRQL